MALSFRSFLALALSCTYATALGSSEDETFKLLANDGKSHDGFGANVAVSGTLAIVGSPEHGHGSSLTGAAYLFDTTTGLQLMELFPAAGPKPSKYLGSAVAIDGTRAVVATSWVANPLAVYVFDTTLGTEIAKFTAVGGPFGGSYFGWSVAISGNTLMVGAPKDDTLGNNAGAVYLFNVTTGQQIAKLLPLDGHAGHLFGSAVAISGNRAIVGVPADEFNGPAAGAAYVFDTTTGAQVAKLLPDDGGASDRFGTSVGISAGIAVVGQVPLTGSQSGAAYLFDLSTGNQTLKLLPNDGADGDLFGMDVSLSGTAAIVGARGQKENGYDAGAAYVFDATTGVQLTKLLASDGALFDQLGNSVSISGSTAVVGARRDGNGNGVRAGSAYVYEIPSVLGSNYCGPAQLNSSGQSALITAIGSASVVDNDVELLASQMAQGQFGFFLTSMVQGFVTPPGSQGTLCLSGGIGRYHADIQTTGPAGAFALQLDLTDTPTPAGPVSIQPGETWYWQAWFRDQNPAATSNFTDGVGVTFN